MAMDHETGVSAPLSASGNSSRPGSCRRWRLVEATLERIDHYNSRLGAFITVTHELALEQAREAEAAVVAGDPLGPLHGIPVPIKDLEGVKGVRFTTHGSVPADEIATSDALCVERIRDAGGIIIGKTNTPEFGFSGTTENLVYGPCRNPWNPERTSGGSSGGAGAAVAAGLTAVAQGSDGGGSIRIPSALNGIYGLKATQGRIPRPPRGHEFLESHQQLVGRSHDPDGPGRRHFRKRLGRARSGRRVRDHPGGASRLSKRP